MSTVAFGRSSCSLTKPLWINSKGATVAKCLTPETYEEVLVLELTGDEPEDTALRYAVYAQLMHMAPTKKYIYKLESRGGDMN